MGLGAGVGVAPGVPPGVGETPGVPVAVPCGVPVGVTLGRAVVARAVGVRVTDGWPACAPDSSSDAPGGRISSHSASTEATRRTSSAPRNRAPEGMALDGSWQAAQSSPPC